MDFFEWTDNFETGIKLIDFQHKELFNKIDDLSLALYQGKGKSELDKVIKFLSTYIHGHFQTEEELMLKNKYPKLIQHQKSHQHFIYFYDKIIHEIDVKGADNYLAIKVEKEIRNWWENHILKEDMEYVPFIKFE